MKVASGKYFEGVLFLGFEPVKSLNTSMVVLTESNDNYTNRSTSKADELKWPIQFYELILQPEVPFNGT